MVTKHPFPLPAQLASHDKFELQAGPFTQEEKDPQKVLKRLEKALQKEYPNWKITIKIQAWTPEHVLLQIDARRGANPGAPPPPANDSPQAVQLEQKIVRAMERLLPNLAFEARYGVINHDAIRIIVEGRGPIVTDPPVCADGGVVLYPHGETGLRLLLVPSERDRDGWIYVRNHTYASPNILPFWSLMAPKLSTFLVQVQDYSPSAMTPAPPLTFGGASVNLMDGGTLGAKLKPNVTLPLSTSALLGCWVWRWS